MTMKAVELKPKLRSQEDIYKELAALAKVRKDNLPTCAGTQLDYCTKYRAEALMWTLQLVKTPTIVPSRNEIALMSALY